MSEGERRDDEVLERFGKMHSGIADAQFLQEIERRDEGWMMPHEWPQGSVCTVYTTVPTVASTVAKIRKSGTPLFPPKSKRR